jgi:hypothetical protein
MSGFRGRIAEEQAQAQRKVRGPSVRRDWAVAIITGFVLQGILVGILLLTGVQSVLAPVLLLPIVAFLGWRFGPRMGVASAIAPMGALLVAELIRQRVTGDDSSGPVTAIIAVVSVMVLLAGIAFIFGAIRDRYKPRRVPVPDGE